MVSIGGINCRLTDDVTVEGRRAPVAIGNGALNDVASLVINAAAKLVATVISEMSEGFSKLLCTFFRSVSQAGGF